MENLTKSFLSISILFTLVWQNSGSNSSDFGYSTYCRKCISACELTTQNKYDCKTDNWTFKGAVYDWDYCSINATQEYLGNKCLNDCAFRGESYQWCHAEDIVAASDYIGYCSGNCDKPLKMELPDPDYGFSTYCQPCITPCQKSKYGTYVCATRKWSELPGGATWTWDFCSPKSGVDYKGNECLGKCEFKDGKNFLWCKTAENDTRGHCSWSGKVLCDFITAEAYN